MTNMTLVEPVDDTLQQERPAAAEKTAVTLSEAIIEIISDSGEGAQKCGQSLGEERKNAASCGWRAMSKTLHTGFTGRVNLRGRGNFFLDKRWQDAANKELKNGAQVAT